MNHLLTALPTQLLQLAGRRHLGDRQGTRRKVEENVPDLGYFPETNAEHPILWEKL